MESKTLIDKQSDRPFTEFPSYTIPCLGNWFSYGGGGGGGNGHMWILTSAIG